MFLTITQSCKVLSSLTVLELLLSVYLNISPVIGTLLSKRMATLHELDTVYGTQDVYDMLEVIAVDDYNEALSRQE